jgi:uncharacterized membrane protein
MKKVIAIMVVLTLALTAVSRGKDSPKGGGVGEGESFNIDVPTLDVKVKQGETQVVTIKLQRGEAFKQDVKLQIETAGSISVDPAKVLVKASDAPEVQLTITAPEDAALGDYTVSVMGTPETGEATSVDFKVTVLAMEAGYTIKSDSPKGGGPGKGEEFSIAAPIFDTKTKQGETTIVTISLKRGESFKQDVTLETKLTKGEGLILSPAKVIVKADDEPDVQIKITASSDTAIGKYIIVVTGTPETGEATSTEFEVNVVAP